MELESVCSRRGKKTSLIAGSMGLPSSISKSSNSSCSTAAATRTRKHGRAHSVSSRSSTRSNVASPLPSFTLSPKTGHVLRHSSDGGSGGGFGFGVDGDEDDHGGRRIIGRPGGGGSVMSVSSSLSPIRQVRHGGGGGGGGQPLRPIGPRAVVLADNRRLDLDLVAAAPAASSAVPESLVYGSGRGGLGVGEGDGHEDTTAAKLERLHSLSAAFDSAASTTPPTLAATVSSKSEDQARTRQARPQRHARNAAAPGVGVLLDPPPAPPTLAATVASVSEGVAVRHLKRQQRSNKSPRPPGATSSAEISA